ncbi:hypothetical protein KJ853_00135 [Patescibacteria group bacterium]|nr:hypothetical protein [Patescibacteria group bacterium]
MIKTEEILIKGGKNKKTVCDIFSYEPENIEEASLGNLYMVSELAANDDSDHLISLLSSLIKREYYCQPHRGPLESLETSLKKANQALNDFANQGNLGWLGKLHFICAVINKEKDIFLSQSGRAQAFLCREESITNITKKIIPSPDKPHPAKTFQSVISGNIGPNDKLFFATPALFDFFNPSGFKQLFSFPKIELISDQINKTLREEKKVSPFSALLMEIVPEESPLPLADIKKSFITPPINLEEILS